MEAKIVFKNEGQRFNVLGDHQQIKFSGKDTNGQYLSVYQDNPPDTQIPMHIHENEDEVYTIIEGQVQFTVGDNTTLLKDGDSIFLPRQIPHTWKVVGSTNAKVYLEVFPAGIEGMFEELSLLPPGPPDFPKVVEICGRYGVKFV